MNKNIEHMLSTLLVGNDAKDALRGEQLDYRRKTKLWRKLK